MTTENQIRRLLKFLTVLVFLVALDCLLLADRNDLAPKNLPSQGRLLPVRQLGETSLVLYPAGTVAQKEILEEQLVHRYLLVEYRPTWPEYAGYALAGLFGLCVLWFLYSVVCEEWTAERASYVVRSKLTSFAALFFTYGVAAGLGWLWMPAWPFLAMGFCVLGFGAMLKSVPVNSKPKPDDPNYLWVRVH